MGRPPPWQILEHWTYIECLEAHELLNYADELDEEEERRSKAQG